MKIKENVPLGPLTTLGVGGPARYYSDVSTLEELESAIDFSKQKSLPVFVLGGGSNVLISDKGFPGIVFRLRLKGIDFEPLVEDKVRVTACGGEDWDKLVEVTVEKGLYGIENLSYVPGSVGAAPIQNIGCYGSEVADVVDWVEVFDIKSGAVIKMENQECAFGYRTSLFKRDLSCERIVTRISLILSRKGTVNTEYHDFTKYTEQNKKELKDPSDVRTALLDIRNNKGMTVTGDKAYKSAGSFFKAPDPVDRVTIEAVGAICRNEDSEKASSLEPWNWELPNGKYKIAPAFLLEFTPYNKSDYVGEKFNGTVGISPKHSLSLINCGNAKAQDFYDFVQEITDSVYSKFKIKLEPEVRYVGF